MKKFFISLTVICSLFIGCFFNPICVKAEYCPYWLPDQEEHYWGNGWEEVSGFYCNTERVFQRECAFCEKVETRRIPATQHKWGKWEIVEKPTYFEKGYKERECSVCYKYEYKYLKKKKFTKQQKKARSVVTKYFKAAKKYNVRKMNKLFIKKGGYETYPKNKKVAKIIRKCNKKKLKYKLIAISGHGINYHLTYSVTFPDLGKEAYKASFSAHQFEKERGYKKSKKIKKFVKLSKKYKGKTHTLKVTFNLVKIKKKWRIAKRTDRMVNIASALYPQGDTWGEFDAPKHAWSETDPDISMIYYKI